MFEGKGTELDEMTKLGLQVPPGFNIITEVCVKYYENKEKLPTNLMLKVKKISLKSEEEQTRSWVR